MKITDKMRLDFIQNGHGVVYTFPLCGVRAFVVAGCAAKESARQAIDAAIRASRRRVKRGGR